RRARGVKVSTTPAAASRNPTKASAKRARSIGPRSVESTHACIRSDSKAKNNPRRSRMQMGNNTKIEALRGMISMGEALPEGTRFAGRRRAGDCAPYHPGLAESLPDLITLAWAGRREFHFEDQGW